MTNTRERLQELQAEAGKQHSGVENRRRRRTARSKAINVAIALIALAAAGASTAEMTATTTVLATGLLIALCMNLALTDTQQDRDLHLLSHAWRRHRTDATRLLAQETTTHSATTAQSIQRETIELACRVVETRASGY